MQYRFAPAFALFVAVIALAAPARADVWRVTYDLDGSRFDIRGTPFGIGDGSFPVGPGTLVVDYPIVGDALVEGTVQMRSYNLVLNFTAGGTGAEVTSDLDSQANFSGAQTFSEGTLSNGVLTWTQSFPYKVQGTNTCVGGFCGFAGFTEGVPQAIDSEDPFTFAAFTFEAGGPQAGAAFDGGEVAVPGSDSAQTFLLLAGTEISRERIDTTPPTLTLLGEASISVDCGSDYDDAGATAQDNVSVSNEVVVGGDIVDTATPGTYVLVYTVNDDAGNAATPVNRTVTVLDNCIVQEGEGEGISEGEGAIDGEGITEGVVEGQVEGEGSAEGEGVTEGEGAIDGEGAIEGEGVLEGEGLAEGAIEGSFEGEGISEGEGFVDGEGVSEGSAEGEGLSEGEGVLEGEGAIEGEGILEGAVDGEGFSEGEGISEGEGLAEGEGATEGEGEPELHSADTNGNGICDLEELLRVIQFYNGGGFSCALETEDGFALGEGDRACTPHASDYQEQDWVIALSELLRLIQIFNVGSYAPCELEEDGFCIGGQVGEI